MIEWMKSHLAFCILSAIVLVLIVVLIIILAHDEKRVKTKNKGGISLKNAGLKKEEKPVEEDIKMQKPILKTNMKTGEKIDPKAKQKVVEKPQEVEEPASVVENEPQTANQLEQEKPLEQAEVKERPVEVAEQKIEEKPEKKQDEKSNVEEEIVKEIKQEDEKKTTKKASVKKSKEKSVKADKTNEKKESAKMAKEVEKKDSETYRVVYDKEQKNWIVRIDGGQRASRRCATKEEAMKVAKDLAKKKDADLSVHKKNGKFQKH